MSQHTTWIDLTDMVGWTGQHGGTQRVVYGIAEEYYLANQVNKAKKVKFFSFNNRSKQFFVADFEPIRQEYEKTVREATSDSALDGAHRKKALAKHLAFKYAPQFIKNSPKTRKTLLLAAKKSYDAAKQVKGVLVQSEQKAPHMIGREEAKFAKGDTVMLLGKPWDTPHMTPALAGLKDANGFTVVAVIYDLIISLYPHLHSPSLFKAYTQYMFDIAQCADLVLPISKSSENDFFRFCDELQLPRPKSKVIRIADSVSNVRAQKPQLPIRFMDEKYILCVGTVEVRKNHTLLYYVYKLAQERNIHLPKLIIVGRRGWNATDVYNIIKNDKDISKNMTILENVNDNELEWLYDNCELTVYPSMYEGWGLPVAESLQHGKVVVASNSSSIPEIAGDLLEYFSSYSADECLHLIIKYLEEPRKSSTEKAIRKNYAQTTWKDTFYELQYDLNKTRANR